MAFGKRGTAGSARGGLPGEVSEAWADLETKIQTLQYTVSNTVTANTTTAGPTTIASSTSIQSQSYAGAMIYVLPTAIVGKTVTIVKLTTNAGTITVRRSGSDTIHGSTNDYVLDGSDYVTSATTYRRSWTLVCLTAGNWDVI